MRETIFVQQSDEDARKVCNTEPARAFVSISLHGESSQRVEGEGSAGDIVQMVVGAVGKMLQDEPLRSMLLHPLAEMLSGEIVKEVTNENQ